MSSTSLSKHSKLIGLTFICLGLLALGMAITRLAQSRYYHSWTETPCTIIDFSLSHGDDGAKRVNGTFSYRINEQEYTSERLTISQAGTDNIGSYWDELHREVKKLAGKTDRGRCYVNPDDPSEAIYNIDARWPLILFFAAFGLIFPIAGGFMLYFPRLAQKLQHSNNQRQHLGADVDEVNKE